ncbi:TPA: hypothetical protein ACSP71_004277 [Aeromonas hydrophila]|uniref:hypothetical protein n=1 Tax=Aeromonas TaxID=642 RepID=UPI001CC9BBCA|nr:MULTISPECIES: hypothetical protein [Aeromonas]MCK0184434.1 hypothetical protein [Aeromonas hydrophila]MCR3950457.1 hypothetical protein [Aeromonas hydrophila]MCW4614691.1 hypothetical protein [Aeromonas hydrophila]UBQ50138.1 hypothetical protein LCH17_20050 [Aeromonas hydrophila]UCM56045.1 hypothetical protein LEO74_13460 [Aeromonas hydrophila]
MKVTLISLNEALQDNFHLIEGLLQQQKYDEAIQCMDNRLALIDQLAQLAKECQLQRQVVAEFAAKLSIQEETLQALTISYHNIVFKKLVQVGKGNKAGQAYNLNSKEF